MNKRLKNKKTKLQLNSETIAALDLRHVRGGVMCSVGKFSNECITTACPKTP